MRLLLDTQTFLWWLSSPEKVNAKATARIEGERTNAFISSVLSWEISIKYSIGKLQLPQPPGVFVENGIRRGGFVSLPVDHQHALRVAELPFHHKDPFDRLLVSQAQIEGMTIVTSDPVFEKYSVEVLWSG